ncbi:9241_t:CDS:2 [Rhizophagus irregularis]|nr:9241_t:CDS:2 [Rhizophagus irregularis]
MENNAKPAGGAQIWRKELYSILGAFSFLYLSITTVFFYIRRRRIADIRYRPLRLNILNVIASITLCVMACLRTAFYPNFPCALVNWPAYIERLEKDFPGVKLMNRLKMFKHFTTDKWLTYWIIFPTMLMALIFALVEQLTSPNLSIIPLSTNCTPAGIEYIPLHILNGTFLILIIPFLICLIYNIKDAYGLRNELMFNLVSGAIAYIGYFMIELVFPRWKNYFGSLMLAWVTFIICHTVSITIPLIQSFNNKVYSLPNSIKSSKRAIKRSLSTTKRNNQNNQNNIVIGDGKSKRYLMFEKVLEDSELFERYKVCAAACFCAELVIFLQEYQYLKILVAHSCTPSNKEVLPPPSPVLHITETGHVTFPNNSDLLNTSTATLVSPTFVTTPCTKSIAETVTAASWIPMPFELRTDYSTFYETFFDSNSDLAINFPGCLLSDIKEMVKDEKYELTMYEEAREEVLNLLYRNTFERFLKMYGIEIEKKGIYNKG